jgi:signal transduction histidine kinase
MTGTTPDDTTASASTRPAPGRPAPGGSPGRPTAPASARPWQSLRWRLALLGTLAIYVPVLLVFGVAVVTEEEVTETQADGTEVTSTGSPGGVRWTVVALGPISATLAWWWAGRAVRPIDRVRAVADDIEASDLGRRIALTRGPTEVVALAGAFDAMLDRLDAAAHTQRRLIEEASHELRTPLSLLRANAEVLLAHPDPDAAVYREGLERSRAAAVRLQATIDELLVDARGRARTLDRRPDDLAAIVRCVADEARVPAAARGVDVVVEGPATLPCSLDEPTVRRAVANLVDNAVRHAPAGSAVTLAVAVPVPDDAGTSHVAVTVTDHGPGVPARHQAHIFDRFWQATHPNAAAAGAGGGTGLGLAIARHVARAHGGDVRVTSPGPDGDGAVFTLTLRR